MDQMKKFILLAVFLFQSVSSADLVLSPETQDQIALDLAGGGMATVIVGISDNNEETQPASAIKCAKKRFMRSTPVAESLVSQSMQVVDELENLPFIVISIDAKGLDELKKHPQVVSIEADHPIKLQ